MQEEVKADIKRENDKKKKTKKFTWVLQKKSFDKRTKKNRREEGTCKENKKIYLVENSLG